MARTLFKRASGLVDFDDGAGQPIPANLDPAISALATVGAGALTTQLLGTGFIYRTGPVGAFAETFDTGANIEAGFGANLDIGDTILIVYSNQVAQVPTFTASAGVTIGSTKVAGVASVVSFIVLKKTAVGVYVAYVL